jgi:predicted dehydrogenase
MASSEAVRWAIMGTGDINRRFLPGVRESDEATMLAIASRDQARADAFAARERIPRAYGSYEAMLADPEIEAVYICVPNSLHHGWTMRALGAGKHVLCEKPYTRKPEEVDEAWDAAERAGLLLMEGFMWRHTPQTDQLVDAVGSIGELRAIHGSFSFLMPDGYDIRIDASLDGGSLMDVGCYCVSAMRLLAGEPESVTGQQIVGPTGVDIRFAGTLRFAGDVLGAFDCGFTSDHNTLEVLGTGGWVHATVPFSEQDGALIVNGEHVPRPYTNPYRAEVEDMSRAIRTGGRTRLGRDDARGQARTIGALYLAADTGTAVSLADA